MTKIEKVKYLIIGNSAGGIGAAEAIRELDKKGKITIVSDEPYPAYSRPLISEYLAEGRPLERMLFRPADFYEENDIQTVLGRRVERLDCSAHTVELDDGSRISWGRLLLATGGLPIVPRLEGREREGVFSFTKLDDARAIAQFLDRYPKRKVRAVVIGGGLIGVSAAEALVRRGVEVTIIEMKERILNTILDEEASALEEETLRQAGVEVITGHTVAKISSYRGDAVTGVALDDGYPMPCELIVVAIGVRPRIELVSGTGVKTNQGIIVDRHMASSCPDVYACGDAAEAFDFVYGENRLTPVWPDAYLGGRIAGFNMAGESRDYQGGTAVNSLKYFGLAAVSAGMVNPPDNSYELLSKKYGHSYKKMVLKEGLVVGMVFVGDIEKAGIVFNLMKDRVDVSGFKEALVAPDFGLVSLPEELWRPQLELSPLELASLPARPESAEEMLVGE